MKEEPSVHLQRDANNFVICYTIFTFMKRLISVLLLLSSFLQYPSLSHAQISESNCVLTQVGNPAAPSPNCGKKSTTLITEASDYIRQGYVKCGRPSGATYLYDGLGGCLRGELQRLSGNKYTDIQLQAFEAVRRSVIANNCSQCIGYVKSVLALVDESTSPIPGSTNANTVINSATNGNFMSGRYRYTLVGRGTAADIQPGDVGATNEGVWGHILIVKQVHNNTHFYAYESHWHLSCGVTDNVLHPKANPQTGAEYYFYRRQDTPAT